MSSDENRRHLERILYRESFERKTPQAGRGSDSSDAFFPREQILLAMWLRAKERLGAIIARLNSDLSAIGAAIRVSDNAPRHYASHSYPSIGRLRLDFFQDDRRTTRHLEADLSENGTVHVYMYLPKETRRLDLSVEEMEDDRIEAMLLDFVDLSTRDDFPRHP